MVTSFLFIYLFFPLFYVFEQWWSNNLYYPIGTDQIIYFFLYKLNCWEIFKKDFDYSRIVFAEVAHVVKLAEKDVTVTKYKTSKGSIVVNTD